MTLLNQTSRLIKRWQDNPELNIQKTPLGVSGILLGLLKDHFSLNNPKFKYSENPVETRILLDLHQQWNPADCENYPGVYIKRVNWSPRTEARVMGDYKELLLQDDGYSYEFWTPISASYNIIVVGKQYGEIELLLDDIATYFTVFWEPIARCLKFHRFEVVGVPPVELLQEEKAYRYGMVNMALMFDFVWRLTLEKPLIQKTRLESND